MCFLKGIKHYLEDRDDEVKSNTIYTIGVLCSQSNGALKDEYESIIKELLVILSHEKNKQTIDNICGTFCRLCMSGIALNVANIDYAMVRVKNDLSLNNNGILMNITRLPIK